MSDLAPHIPSGDYKWQEIVDLPPDIMSLHDRELELLADAWNKEKDRLDPQHVQAFNERLEREWAIETGIIEGIYTLDRGVTQTLIERGIDSAHIPHDASNRDPELVARIVQAHAEVLEGLFAFVKGERVLSTGYVKDLHAALLRNQESVPVFNQFGQAFETKLETGLYKTQPNNPRRANGGTHEYCPPEHVASEMDRLIQLHHKHDQGDLQPHIEAAWLHHAFTQIHPFQDGNGRVARTLASLVFIKRGFFPLVINRDDRAKYIESLELADEGDMSHLVRLFAQVQKRALTTAIGAAVEIRPAASVEEAVAAARDMLLDLGRIIPTEYLAAKDTAGFLANQTHLRFAEVTSKLKNEIARVNSSFEFRAVTLGGPPPNAIRQLAEKLRYDPNTNDYHQSVAAVFRASTVESQIVVSFHSVGSAFRGLVVAVGYFQVGGGPPVPLSDDVFRISYQEPRTEIETRYGKWLDDRLIKGLAEWRRTLV